VGNQLREMPCATFGCGSEPQLQSLEKKKKEKKEKKDRPGQLN
jgi:hypothetical protein